MNTSHVAAVEEAYLTGHEYTHREHITLFSMKHLVFLRLCCEKDNPPKTPTATTQAATYERHDGEISAAEEESNRGRVRLAEKIEAGFSKMATAIEAIAASQQQLAG